MIGSETFIMVAFICSENSVPSFRVRSICSWKKAFSALADRKVASTIVPAGILMPSLSVVTVPSAAVSSIRNAPSACASVRVTDVSLEKKSLAPIVDTRVLLSADHVPMRCGFARAYALTEDGARRSELPSRNTGFTADPLIASYRARASSSSGVIGASG